MKLKLVVIAIVVTLMIIASVAIYYLEYTNVVSYTSIAQVSQYTIEYPTDSSQSEPSGIAIDSNGNVWFTLQNQSKLAELTPSTGRIHEFSIPSKSRGGTTTWGIVVDNSRHLVWFTEQSTNAIWSFGITTHKFKEYKINTPNSFPFCIALGPNGSVWFTEFFSDKMGEVTTNGSIIEIPIPVKGTLEPSGIVVDHAGKVWFTLSGVNEIGSYFNGDFQFYNLTGLVTIPAGIAIDSQGNIWMTEHGPSFISEFNPTTHYFRTISTVIPPYGSSLPYFDYMGQNGVIWFNEHEGNAMSEFIPANNTLIEYYIPTELRYAGNISGMLTSNVSPGGVPWYTEFFAGKVGTINTTAPLNLRLTLPNYTQPLKMGPETQISLQVRLSGQLASAVTIKESVGNFSSDFSFAILATQSGTLMTIRNNNSASGAYFVTVSAVTRSLAVSKIIEVDVA